MLSELPRDYRHSESQSAKDILSDIANLLIKRADKYADLSRAGYHSARDYCTGLGMVIPKLLGDKPLATEATLLSEIGLIDSQIYDMVDMLRRL
jgi:hypothetical protein